MRSQRGDVGLSFFAHNMSCNRGSFLSILKAFIAVVDVVVYIFVFPWSQGFL